MELSEIKQRVEAVLFVSPYPVTIEKLAEVVSVPVGSVTEVVRKLSEEYADRGIRLREVNGGWHFFTAPDVSFCVEKFLALPPKNYLTRTTLEILAIIAYRQPVTRAQIETIRGVKTDKQLTNLMEKGLVKPVGKADVLGRPFLYGTTEEFLRYFGLRSLADLPPLPNIEGMQSQPLQGTLGFETEIKESNFSHN